MSKPLRLDEDGRKQVSAAVSKAEAASAGEIVTIVAERSDGYTDVALCWAAAAAVIALGVFAAMPFFYLARIDWLLGNWQTHWTPREVLTIGLGIVVLKFLGMMLIQLWQPLKFWLIPPPIKATRVRERAVSCFKVGAERRTHGRTGILIYLSMREHRAEIVADEAIATKVDAAVWGNAMALLIAEIKQGRIAEGMCKAVDAVGAVLAEHFPRAEDDQNELPDRLIEL